MKRKQILAFALVLCMVLTMLPTAAFAAETVPEGAVYVDAGSSANTPDGSKDNPYKTIQAAVDAAADNSTIWIANGTYKEAIQTPAEKTLTLVGQSQDGVVIQYNPDDTRNDTVSYRSSIPMVYAAGNLTLQDLTVAGPVPTSAGHRLIGGVLGEKNLTIDHVTVCDIRCQGDGEKLCGVQIGHGIMARGNGNVTITNSSVINFQKNGIDVDTTGTVKIDKVTVKGVGAQGIIAQNGIVVRDGSATITGCTISNLSYTANNEWAYGSVAIYPLENVKALTVTGNTITSIDNAIDTSALKKEVLEAAKISDNTISGLSCSIKVGDKTFATLQSAIDTATEGQEIVLTDNITVSAPIMMPTDKTVSIKGGGHTISFAGGGVFSGKAANNLEGMLSGAKLIVDQVVFHNTNGANQGYAAIINFNSTASVSFTGCTFENMYCAVYANPVSDASITGPSISITGCTYKDTTYGYSIDDVTNGAISGKTNVTFSNNTGVKTEKEPFTATVVTLTHDKTVTNYQSIENALAAAVSGDVITLKKDITTPVTVAMDGITINGNGFGIKTESGNALTINADNVVLKNLTATSGNGIALVVNVGAENLKVEGGNYQTAIDGSNLGKQGEGAMRFEGSNGNITVTGATLVGGLHVIDYTSGTLTIHDNNIGFTYTGDTALVGILVHGSTADFPAGLTVASLSNNNISVPNASSYYLRLEKNDWSTDPDHSSIATNCAATIGDARYNTLAAAVAAVKGNEIIVLQKDNAESVKIGRAVIFYLKPNNHKFTGSITAMEGYSTSTSTTSDGRTRYSVFESSDNTSHRSKSYSITIQKATNGTVASGSASAKKNAEVTLTVTPDKGYELNKLTITDANGDTVKATKKSDNKYTFTMPASKVTVKATFQKADESSSMPFTDVSSKDWYNEAVQYVYNNKLMNGTSSSKFSPNSKLTRGMIAQILYNLEGQPKVSGSAPFDDVASNAWYSNAVMWAEKNNLVTGYGNGKFGPENNITREQLAAILYRYAQYKNYSTSDSVNLSKFTDGDAVSSWAVEAVKWAAGSKLCNGKSNNVLDPTGTATRAEVAQMMMNFCENIAK